MRVPNNKSLLIVTECLDAGGTEGQMAMLAEHLVRRGWRVQVFAFDAQGEFAPRLHRAGVRTREGGRPAAYSSRFRRLIALGRTQFELIWICLRDRPQVVHSFLPVPNFLGALAGRLGFVSRVITSKRALGVYQERHPILRQSDRISNALSDVVVANSRAVALDAARRDHFPESNIRVIPNGLPPPSNDELNCRAASRRELGIEDGQLALVNVANLFAYKGHFDLIEAFRLIERGRPDIRLFLVGKDRGIQAALAERIRLLELEEKIVFLGPRSDVNAILAAMDVGVLPSHEEGLSNALLEKLAVGLPVVATDVGGNADALEGMPNCRLVRPRDPEDLARGLSEVIDIIRRGDNGRETRRQLVEKRHSVERMVDAYECLYLG